MTVKKCIFLNLLLLLSFSSLVAQMKYKNPNLPVAERVKDLLNQMTLEEKVGQVLCPLGWEMYEKKGNKVAQSPKFEELVKERHIGMLWATFRADPWTQKTIENGLNPALSAEAANALQRYMVEKTRLGIPIFLAEECPHGHMAIGTTVFPTAIGQAATWNPALIQQMSATIAKESRSQGAHIGYGPVLDLAREPRWSRTEESYGEDPILISKIGEAYVTGFGGGDLKKDFSMISTLKHFVAYGVPEGGHNGGPNNIGMRDLEESYLPPFRAAVDAGALSIMTAYNSIDGIPCTAHEYLLRDVLKGKWKFRGYTVSDLGSVEGLKGSHHIVGNIQDAAILSLRSGLDVDLGGNAFFQLIAAIKDGKIKESYVDEAAANVLRLKFEMGLFENPYVDVKKVSGNVRNASHVQLARQVAKEAVTLLENKNSTLPLKKDIKRIALIGPNADNIYNQLGDYTAPQEEGVIRTVLDGVKSKFDKSKIDYIKGCAIRDTTQLQIEQAVAAAKNADVVIAVVGGSSARDFKTKYIDTGAAVASDNSVSDMESGEGFDRVSLDLMGKQLDLLKALKQTGKPLVVVYIAGRPLNMNWASEHADALLTAWYPGQEGGNAIAEILAGDYNPAGRLPISIPRSVGQIPIYYNQKKPKGHDYVEMTQAPLYPFGYGLSYTQFTYGDMNIQKNGELDYTVKVTVTNTGNRDGDEVVQLYIDDEVASTVRPIKQLRHFSRINLAKGERKEISYRLTKKDFSLINSQMQEVVEPGKFIIQIGTSSEDIRSTESLLIE